MKIVFPFLSGSYSEHPRTFSEKKIIPELEGGSGGGAYPVPDLQLN